MAKDEVVEVKSDDAKILLDRFPATFGIPEVNPLDLIPDPVVIPDEDEGYLYGDGEEGDVEAATPDEKADNQEEFTFETDADGSFLCPLCDKSYKVNLGRGKSALIKHLESEHGEEWAKMKEEAFSTGD